MAPPKRLAMIHTTNNPGICLLYTSSMPLEDLIDKDKEIERLTKETERLTKEIARCEGMLNNPNFVNKAPAAKVDAEKDKLAKYKEMMDKVKGQLEQLKK